MGWAQPAHNSWLLCMSTVTSFTSSAETCTVHVLHGEGRNESKRGGGFTWRSLGRQWWPAVAVVPGGGGVGGSWRFLPPVFPCFSLCFVFVFVFVLFLFFLPFFLFGSFFSFFWSFHPLLFSVLSHIFIGENKGETLLGRPLCNCSTTTRGARFLLFSLPRGRP